MKSSRKSAKSGDGDRKPKLQLSAEGQYIFDVVRSNTGEFNLMFSGIIKK